MYRGKSGGLLGSSPGFGRYYNQSRGSGMQRDNHGSFDSYGGMSSNLSSMGTSMGSSMGSSMGGYGGMHSSNWGDNDMGDHIPLNRNFASSRGLQSGSMQSGGMHSSGMHSSGMHSSGMHSSSLQSGGFGLGLSSMGSKPFQSRSQTHSGLGGHTGHMNMGMNMNSNMNSNVNTGIMGDYSMDHNSYSEPRMDRGMNHFRAPQRSPFSRGGGAVGRASFIRGSPQGNVRGSPRGAIRGSPRGSPMDRRGQTPRGRGEAGRGGRPMRANGNAKNQSPAVKRPMPKQAEQGVKKAKVEEVKKPAPVTPQKAAIASPDKPKTETKPQAAAATTAPATPKAAEAAKEKPAAAAVVTPSRETPKGEKRFENLVISVEPEDPLGECQDEADIDKGTDQVMKAQGVSQLNGVAVDKMDCTSAAASQKTDAAPLTKESLMKELEDFMEDLNQVQTYCTELIGRVSRDEQTNVPLAKMQKLVADMIDLVAKEESKPQVAVCAAVTGNEVKANEEESKATSQENDKTEGQEEMDDEGAEEDGQPTKTRAAGRGGTPPRGGGGGGAGRAVRAGGRGRARGGGRGAHRGSRGGGMRRGRRF